MNKQIGIIATIIPLLLGADSDKSPYESFNGEVLSLESLASVIGQIEKKQMFQLEEVETETETEIEEVQEVQEEVFVSRYSNLERTYRQTYYSVEQGETSLGSGYNNYSQQVKNIDNVMNFNDPEFGYLPIIAVNINEVKESGQNSKGIWNMYGTVVELNYSSGEVQKAIILDACGACSRADKVDLWVMNNNVKHDVENVELKVIRDGWGYEDKINYEN